MKEIKKNTIQYRNLLLKYFIDYHAQDFLVIGLDSESIESIIQGWRGLIRRSVVPKNLNNLNLVSWNKNNNLVPQY